VDLDKVLSQSVGKLIIRFLTMAGKAHDNFSLGRQVEYPHEKHPLDKAIYPIKEAPI
jgi:hypothetical protein